MKIKYLLVVGLVLCSAQVQALAKGRGINSQPVVRVVIPHFIRKNWLKVSLGIIPTSRGWSGRKLFLRM